jgi:hypothetical protein
VPDTTSSNAFRGGGSPQFFVCYEAHYPSHPPDFGRIELPIALDSCARQDIKFHWALSVVGSVNFNGLGYTVELAIRETGTPERRHLSLCFIQESIWLSARASNAGPSRARVSPKTGVP